LSHQVSQPGGGGRVKGALWQAHQVGRIGRSQV